MDWLISFARATFGVVLSCFLSKAERQNSQLRSCAETEPNDPADRASSSLTTGLGELGCFTLVVPSLFALRQRVGTLRGANGRKLCARNMSIYVRVVLNVYNVHVRTRTVSARTLLLKSRLYMSMGEYFLSEES
jgi:hypothetical protein